MTFEKEHSDTKQVLAEYKANRLMRDIMAQAAQDHVHETFVRDGVAGLKQLVGSTDDLLTKRTAEAFIKEAHRFDAAFEAACTAYQAETEEAFAPPQNCGKTAECAHVYEVWTGRIRSFDEGGCVAPSEALIYVSWVKKEHGDSDSPCGFADSNHFNQHISEVGLLLASVGACASVTPTDIHGCLPHEPSATTKRTQHQGKREPIGVTNVYEGLYGHHEPRTRNQDKTPPAAS